MSARPALTLAALACSGVAAAEPPAVVPDKYKLMDAARLAIVAALDQHDAAALAPYVGATLETENLWFSTPGCRKRFATAHIKPGKDLRALVACFAPLGVTQHGLLVSYGPGITLSVKLDVNGGKATVTKLSAFAGDPRNPEIFLDTFESHRTAGEPRVPLDAPARAELEALPRGIASFRVCVNAKGHVASHATFDLDEAGPLAHAITAAVAGWSFRPFTIRAVPLPVCAIAFVRAKEPAAP